MPAGGKESKLDLLNLEGSSDSEEEQEEVEEKDSRFSKSRLRSILSSSDVEDNDSDKDSDNDDDDDDDDEIDSVSDQDGNDNPLEGSEEESDTESTPDKVTDNDTQQSEKDFESDTKRPRIRKKKTKALTPEELEKYEKEKRRTGVCYLSRIPPFMKPTAVRTALSRHADIGRIYLAAEDPKITEHRKKYTKNRRVNYTEGWVEFKDKKVARALAERLNLSQIGGKRKSRYYHDLWNIKYLAKFKWSHLTEQIAYENQARQQRLRNEIAQGTRENKIYLQNVERSKKFEYINEKKRERGEEDDESNKVRRTFDQRSKVDREVSTDTLRNKQKTTSDNMESSVKSVLRKIF